MKAIDYDEAHNRIVEAYLTHGERVEVEQQYMRSLLALGIPENSKLFKEHKSLEQRYLTHGAGIWEALMILSKLEVSDESN